MGLNASIALTGHDRHKTSFNINAKAIARAFEERSEERQREIDAVRSVYEKLPMIPALKETLARRTGAQEAM